MSCLDELSQIDQRRCCQIRKSIVNLCAVDAEGGDDLCGITSMREQSLLPESEMAVTVHVQLLRFYHRLRPRGAALEAV